MYAIKNVINFIISIKIYLELDCFYFLLYQYLGNKCIELYMNHFTLYDYKISKM